MNIAFNNTTFVKLEEETIGREGVNMVLELIAEIRNNAFIPNQLAPLTRPKNIFLSVTIHSPILDSPVTFRKNINVRDYQKEKDMMIEAIDKEYSNKLV